MAADGLKQRLVGGATLLMVAVIAWFWLLSADSPVDPVARETQIPAAPDIQPFAAQEPSAPQNIEPIGSEHESPLALQSDVVPQAKTPVPAVATIAVAAKAQPLNPAPPKPLPQPQPVKPQAKAAAVAAPPASKLLPKPQPKSEPKPEQKAAIKNAKDSKLVAETFQLDQHGLPIAWVVQVGLFSTQAHADKIKATLQEKGFKAYTESFKNDKASGVKVFVGPKLSRERADAQKKAVDDLLKTNTMVVRFVAG